MQPLPIAVRVYALPERRRAKRKQAVPPPLAKWVIVFDTETTTDAAQRLLFGSYRFYRARWRSGALELACVEEALFHADDLAEFDPKGKQVLSRYAATHDPDVNPHVRNRCRMLRLLTRTEFVDRLYLVAYKARALVVGFNLPFDLSRLAVDAGEARGRSAGGFSLVLWRRPDGKENRFRPRIVVKSFDSKRSLIRFARRLGVDREDQIPEGSRTGRPDRAYAFAGHFLDLRTLAFALTDEGHSLASACERFGVTHGKQHAEAHGRITPDYIDYNRSDVRAAAELLICLEQEYGRHPIAPNHGGNS